MFEEDLKSWKKIEREFASKLWKWDVSKVELSEWEFKEWDVKATFNNKWQSYDKTFEIKRDRQVEQTWNVWIEYMYKWHPSWIYTSTANYIVYKLWDKFYYADRVRFIIELSKIEKADVIGGDDDKVNMRLVKREIFNLITKEL